jgi:hypothetical protein
MNDYVYPSIFFSYFLFLLFLAGGVYFCARSYRDYFGSHSEDMKYRMMGDDEGDHGRE